MSTKGIGARPLQRPLPSRGFSRGKPRQSLIGFPTARVEDPGPHRILSTYSPVGFRALAVAVATRDLNGGENHGAEVASAPGRFSGRCRAAASAARSREKPREAATISHRPSQCPGRRPGRSSQCSTSPPESSVRSHSLKRLGPRWQARTTEQRWYRRQAASAATAEPRLQPREAARSGEKPRDLSLASPRPGSKTRALIASFRPFLP